MAWNFRFCCCWCRAAIASWSAWAAPEDFRLYGSTIDDAVGEAFDKTAKILGLPYPGGPAVEQAAKTAIRAPMTCRAPDDRAGARQRDFSFSGLKTALRQLAQDGAVQSASKMPRASSRRPSSKAW